MAKQTKITKSARNQPCLIRIPGVCNGVDETTVLCHLNGGGMGMKRASYEAAYACNKCHDAIDFRSKTKYSAEELKLWHLEGVMRTIKILVEKGLIVINE